MKFDFKSSFGIIKNDGEIQLYDPLNKTRKKQACPTFTRSSRFLYIDKGILVTGGCGKSNQALILSDDFTLTPIASMTHARVWHSIGFIDGFPAVALGAGCSSLPKKYIDSVEVYKNGCWEQYPSANYSRASSIMISDSKYTYLVGGVVANGSNNTVVKVIEQWNGIKWNQLNVEMRVPLLSPGCFCVGDNKIAIFGGESTGGEFVDASYILDLESGKIQELRKLRKRTKFSYAQIKRKGDCLQVLDCIGEFSEIELTQYED